MREATGAVLDRILAQKHEEVAARKRAVSEETLRRRMLDAEPTRGFERRLRETVANGSPAVIAEIKKASPSKGVIRPDFDPLAIADSYVAAGATCLSVLTDEHFFQGNDRHLTAVRARTSLPVLRKDFIVDPYQVLETRALGADCLLLIVAALPSTLLRELHDLARSLSLDVLLEVHDPEELAQALALEPTLIGINNRDLRTFDTRVETTYALLPRVPPTVLVVTESGIAEPDQVRELRRRGVHAFLVGERFMRDPEPGRALARLFRGTNA